MSSSECANWEAILLSILRALLKKKISALCAKYSEDSVYCFCIDVAIDDLIMITCPCNVYPLTPHLYIVKTGVYRDIFYFLIFALKHRLWVLVRTASVGRF